MRGKVDWEPQGSPSETEGGKEEHRFTLSISVSVNYYKFDDSSFKRSKLQECFKPFTSSKHEFRKLKGKSLNKGVGGGSWVDQNSAQQHSPAPARQAWV